MTARHSDDHHEREVIDLYHREVPEVAIQL
jgi:hypothetical protein